MRKLITFLAVALFLVIPAKAEIYSGNITASASNCLTLNACVTAPLSSVPGKAAATAIITLSGTFTATLQFEASANNEATWINVGSSSSTGATTLSVSADTHLRVRCSAYTSGTVTVNISVSTSGTVATFSTYNVVNYGALADGSTDARTAINSAITAAANGGEVYLPCGTYLVDPTAGSVSISANSVSFVGESESCVTIETPSSLTMNAPTPIISITGINDAVHDIKITGPSSFSGTGQLNGIAVGAGAFGSHVYNIECTSLNSGNTAGADCIDLYQPQTQTEISTALGTAVSVAGSTTVTPGSMTGIFAGRLLVIDSSTSQETVLVTTTTATTFTATYTKTHLATAGVVGTARAYQYARVENVYIHDSSYSAGIVAESNGNVFDKIRIVHVGESNLMHGIYLQGGDNVISNSYIEGVYGYGVQVYPGSSSFDLSSNRIVDTTLKNNLTGGAIITTGDTNTTGVPEVGSGINLERETFFIGDHFINTVNASATGIQNSSGAVTVEASSFENSQISSSAACTVIGSTFYDLGSGNTGISCGAHSIVKGSTFNWSYSPSGSTATGNSVSLGANSVVDSNYFLQTNTTGSLNAVQVTANEEISHNTFNFAAAHQYTQALYFSGTVSGFDVSSNQFNVTQNDSNTYIGDWNGNSQSGTFRNNTCSSSGTAANLRIDYAQAGQVISGNSGCALSWQGGLSTYSLTPNMGTLVRADKGAVTLTAGLSVYLDSSGNANQSATTDTSFFGVAAQTSGSATGDGLFVQTGPEIDNWTTDGGWTAGHTAVLSTTSGGELHDTGGVTVPASGAYGILLNSGTGSGAANVLVKRW